MQRDVFFSNLLPVPFRRARAVLIDRPQALFGDGRTVGRDPATETAAGIPAIRYEWQAEIGPLQDCPAEYRVTRHVRLSAGRHPRLVPDVEAVVDASDMGVAGTQVAVAASYRTRLGAVGVVGDAIGGHRHVHEAIRAVMVEACSRLELVSGMQAA